MVIHFVGKITKSFFKSLLTEKPRHTKIKMKSLLLVALLAIAFVVISAEPGNFAKSQSHR